MPTLYLIAGKIGAGNGLIDQAQVPHEPHLLDIPDALCLERPRRRNAAGQHPLQVSDAAFGQFTRHFAPPAPEEGLNVVVHRP